MRRIAKLSLLLAPLFMVPLSGCATPRTASHTVPVDSQQARMSRLMSVAEQYEKDGKTDAAMRLYDHILAQQPNNSQAAERRELLAQQGVKSDGRSLRPEPQALKTPAALASKSRVKSPPDETRKQPEATKQTIAETPRKPLRLSEVLAENRASEESAQEPAPETLVEIADSRSAPVQDVPARDLPVMEQQESLAQQTATVHAEQKPRDAASIFADDQWNATRESNKHDIAAASERDATAEKSASLAATESPAPADTNAGTAAKIVISTEEGDGWIQVKPAADGIELASNSADIPKKPDLENTDVMQSVAKAAPEFPAPVAESNATAPTSSDKEISRKTSPMELCENLPEELAPLVAKLESSDPAVRVKGLLELGDRREEADAASVAVYSLMEDTDPLVAVHAAGTLRQITGDAWSSVHTLTRYLDHENPEIVQLSAYLLGQIGPEAMDAVPALEKLRNTSTGMTSLYAAEALTHIAPADLNSVATLTSALSESNPELRWFAAVSLGTVAGECERQAVEALRKALQDQTTDVRVAACLSLGGLGNHAQAAIPDLKQAARSDAPDVKSAAETALACLGG